MSSNKLVATPTIATLAALAVFLVLGPALVAGAGPLLDPASQGFGGESRSANYDQLLDAFYSNPAAATTIPTATGAALWVPWYSSSSFCTESYLQRGASCDAGRTIDSTHNCMVTDELSQVGILASMGNDQLRMDEYVNTLRATKSTNGNIPAWRVYRNGNTIEACRPGINGNCDTASDATARMIISLYTAAANDKFADAQKKLEYRQFADALAADFARYEIVDTCMQGSNGRGTICHWLAAGSEAARGGVGVTDFAYTGYYPDAITAMLQACSNTGNTRYCSIAGNLTLNYLQAAKFDGNKFTVPPGRSFRWTTLNGIATAECTHTCNPVEWDGADAPRAVAMCEANYYAKHIGYTLPGLDQYCSLWAKQYMSDPASAPIQYKEDGSPVRYESSYFAQGLQALFHTGAKPALFAETLDNALAHYSTTTKTFDWTACFGVYHQAFPVRALGVGIGRNLASFPPLNSHSCTPSMETCDSRDNDCDGQVDEGSVCSSPSSPDGNTCFTSVITIPVTCRGGTITSDANSGSCRTITCSNGADSMRVLACDKSGFFEMYKQQHTGTAVSAVCIGSQCISNSGYVKSSSFPICTGSTSPGPSPSPAPTTPTCTPATEVCDTQDNDCDGQVDENNVCATSATCYVSVRNMPLSCTGTVTEDSWNGCRKVVCSSSGGSIQTLACDKGSRFELYRQAASGTPPRVCFADTCISTGGYVQSASFPICVAGSASPSQPTVSVSATHLIGSSYSFSCSANGFTPTAFDWQFGDGTSFSASQTINYKYSTHGTYLVQCVARSSNTQALGTTYVAVGSVSAQPANSCAMSLRGATASCSGGSISTDTMSGSCRTVICTGSGSSMRVLACEKNGFFEMYKQQHTGSSVRQVCLGGTCLSTSGFARSTSYPVCS